MSEIQYGIAWQENFRLGDKNVDNQHRKLFELLSEIVGSCLDGSDIEKLQQTLDFLVEYTVRHFYDEESLQVQYSYPDYKRHKQLHEEFKATVTAIVEEFQRNGSSAKLSEDVNKTVVKWLTNHIMNEDKKVGAFLHEERMRHVI